MSFSSVVIEGMAYSLPPEIYKSADIEDKLSPLYESLKLPHWTLRADDRNL